jgi:hypothetical protein
MTFHYVAYGVTLALHTYARWGVLLAGIASVATSIHGHVTRRGWSRSDERLALTFVALSDLQLVLGLLLYLWLSPISEAARAAGVGAALSQPSLWFFGFVHPLLMVIGFVVVHATRARSKRAKEDTSRFRTMAIGLCVWLTIVLLAIPWPWTSYGCPASAAT